MSKYRVIYADPPWDFKSNVGASGSNVHRHYATLTEKQMCEMKIAELTKKDAVCFMWVASSCLLSGIKIMKAWGFEFKTIAFVWLKTYNKKPVYVAGPWTGKSCELCLLGIKGKPNKYVQSRPRELIISEREKHSKKPEEARKRIESMFPMSKKLELFAREKANGWDAFGNEIESDVKINV